MFPSLRGVDIATKTYHFVGCGVVLRSVLRRQDRYWAAAGGSVDGQDARLTSKRVASTRDQVLHSVENIVVPHVFTYSGKRQGYQSLTVT
jgi:hypothetical protein